MENTIKPDPKYYTKCTWIHLTISATILIIAAIIHLIISLSSGGMEAITIIWLISIGFILVIWITSYPLIRLWIKNLSYLIYDDRVTIHKGILTKTQQNIPFRAITDFALERTIYDRILKIGSIKIQTAGQSTSPTGYEGKLSGLIDYEQLHADLREKIKYLHPISDSVTISEPGIKSDNNILIQILSELKEIRRNLEK